MSDPGRRDASLDLTEEDLHRLLAGVTALTEQELSATRTGPVFDHPPSAAEVDGIVGADRPLPADGESVEELLAACAAVLAAGRRTTPAFFGYVQSPPAPVGVAADMLASAADQNVTSWRSGPAAAAVEHQTLRWLGEFVGFDAAATGILVSGGSAANLTALLVALRAATGPDDDRRAMRVYASAETHFSVAKAAKALGVGFEPVAVDRDRRLDPEALRAAIASDRAAGLLPICVVANAGTTSTGAVDPLGAVATVAADAGVWLHVDGAYGAPAAAVPACRELFAGLDRADSLCIDAHKWLYAPVDCSVLLLHDAAATAQAFGAGADDYVRILATQPAETFAFWDHGLELSRRFRALKLWMTLRFHGARRLADAIGEDIRAAAHLAELVAAAEDFELVTGPGLSICCFRHTPAHGDDASLDAHNERILRKLQRDGRVYLSNATIDGRFALRACITNFRTTRADVERMLAVVRQLAARFVPDDFEPPRELVLPRLHLVPLGPQHNESDHAAWTSSIAHIRATPGFASWGWPPVEGMSLDANRADLEAHARDFADRTGFTFTVLRPGSEEVIGCLYIYPAADGAHDAQVRSWVRADVAELDAPLHAAVSDWLSERWPFERVIYADRAA